MDEDDIFLEIDEHIDDYDDEVEEIDGTYQFGACIIDLSERIRKTEIHYVMKMPIKLLYNYPTKIQQYLETFDYKNTKRPKLEIFKIKETTDGVFEATITTFWIRLIQRTWKKRYKNKMKVIQNNANPNALRYREMYGNFQQRIPTKMLLGLMVNK